MPHRPSNLTYFFLPCSRLTADDPGQLQMSITSCLGQLSLVIRAMQIIMPPFFTKPQQ